MLGIKPFHKGESIFICAFCGKSTSYFHCPNKSCSAYEKVKVVRLAVIKPFLEDGKRLRLIDGYKLASSATFRETIKNILASPLLNAAYVTHLYFEIPKVEPFVYDVVGQYCLTNSSFSLQTEERLILKEGSK